MVAAQMKTGANERVLVKRVRYCAARWCLPCGAHYNTRVAVCVCVGVVCMVWSMVWSRPVVCARGRPGVTWCAHSPQRVTVAREVNERVGYEKSIERQYLVSRVVRRVLHNKTRSSDRNKRHTRIRLAIELRRRVPLSHAAAPIEMSTC